MRSEGHVGPGNFPDNSDQILRVGNTGEQIVAALQGKFQEHMLRGNLFCYASAAAGVTLNVAGNNQPTIWNPADSGRVFIPVRAYVGYVSGTNVAGHLAWAFQNRVGGNIGTAAPISVFTDITPQPLLLGAGGVPKTRFATTVTFTAAPTYLRPFGVNTAAMAAATAVAPFPMIDDFDGMMGVMPGSALQLCANAAIAMVASVAIIGIEIPLPTQAK